MHSLSFSCYLVLIVIVRQYYLGEVELENVPLRKDALRFLDSSLCVRQGTVGHIKLKVPISQLRSEPWSIEIDQVYVVIAPQCHEDYDEIQDNAVQQEIKLSALGKNVYDIIADSF